MGQPIATISGVAIRPGVSLNRRLYTRETIARAVARAQRRIAEGGAPLTMLTHHGAEDDSERIVGRITALWLAEDGAAHYTAAIANTAPGRTLLELIDPGEDGRAFLEGVSIRGFWRGEVRQVDVAGQVCDTTDDLELDGLDFTKTPGVTGARVDTVTRSGAGLPTESGGRTPIYESAEARVQDPPTEPTTTAPPPAPAAEAAPDATLYADNGYLEPGRRLYPLSTRADAITAWSAISTNETARQYTAAQVKRFRGRTRKALERHGVTVTSEGHLRMAGPAEGAVVEMWPEEKRKGGFSVSLNMGELSVCVSSWCVDPHDLDRITRVAAASASDCLAQITADPDAALPMPYEGGGKPAFLDDDEDDDEKDDDEPTEASTSTTPAATPAADQHQEETAVADTASTTPPATPAATETEDQRVERLVAETLAERERAAAEEARINALVAEKLSAAQAPTETVDERVARIVAEKLAAATPAAPATPAPAAAPAEPQETEEQRVNRLVTAALQSHVEQNGVTRKGYVAPPAGTAPVEAAQAGELPAGWPDKPLHTYTREEWARHVAPATEQAIMGKQSAYQALPA